MSTLNSGDELKRWIGISLAIHLVAVVTLAWYTGTKSIKREFYSPVYRVDLVTIDKPKVVKSKKARTAVKKKVVKKAAPVKKRKKAVPLTKKKLTAKPTVSPKKIKKLKTLSPDPVAAITALRKKHEADLAVEKIKERLKEEVASSGEEVIITERVATAPGPAKSKAGVKKVNAEEMDRALKKYYDLLWEKIERSWILPGSGSFEGMVSIISIVIAGNGDLLETSLEEGSGNGFYDQSAIRAIKKAAPFPPLPESYKGGMEVGFRFKQ